MARNFKGEINFTVWETLLDKVNQVTSLVEEMNSALKLNTQRFLTQLIQPIYSRLGWTVVPGESHNNTMLRPIIINALGRCGFPDVVEESLRRFNRHYECFGDGVHALPADIRSSVYATVLRHGDGSYLGKMMNLLRRTDLQEERVRIMSSLGSVPLQQLHRVQKIAFTDEVRRQDKYIVLMSTVTNAASRSVFWDFMRFNWEGNFKQDISNSNMLGILIKVSLYSLFLCLTFYGFLIIFMENSLCSSDGVLIFRLQPFIKIYIWKSCLVRNDSDLRCN